MLHARLIGAFLTSGLAAMIDSARKTHAILSESIVNLLHAEKFLRARSACNPMDLVIEPNQIAALTPLPGQIAFRLARGVALMNVLAAEIPSYPENLVGYEEGRSNRLKARYESWIDLLDDAIALTTYALDALMSVRGGLVHPELADE